MNFNKNLLFVVIVIALLTYGFTKDNYYNINKAFDVIGAVFREVSSSYVLDVDTDVLTKGAIDGMLATLDPYTEFYDASNQEDYDILTSGTYTGFGISISNIDSMLTITEVRDGYAASEAGIRIGDRICMIDSNLVMSKNYNDVKDMLKGTNGSKASIAILRDGNPDTLRFELIRKQILLDNIPYYDILDSSIGFIKVDRFAPNVAIDFRKALVDIKKRGKIKSLIIDLRDNPGGLLDGAVKICELFLPNGSTIVTTKGRDNKELYKFKSMSEPLEPDLPLVVLINENSASASEIIAGAMQDHDRAVIVGKRSYGKGLVQSVIPMPYNGNLKITTAKYYTPSGRCIQRIKFAEKYQKSSMIQASNDSMPYYTTNGRKVFESTGINPDTSVVPIYESEIVIDLFTKMMFFNFANNYTGKLDELPKDFKQDDKLFEDFRKFLISKDYIFESESEILIKRLNELSKEENYSKNFKKNITSIKTELASQSINQLNKYKSDILSYLETEIKMRFVKEKETTARFINKDDEVEMSIRILKSDQYNKILFRH